MGTIGTTFGRLCATALTRAAAVMAGVATTIAVGGVAFGAQDVALSMGRREARLLTIEGGIDGVRAGVRGAPLRLTLRNAGNDAKQVTRVRAASTGTESGPAACDGGYVTVGDWTGAITVPAKGSATVTLPVAVSSELPPECAAAAWGLVYTAY